MDRPAGCPSGCSARNRWSVPQGITRRSADRWACGRSRRYPDAPIVTAISVRVSKTCAQRCGHSRIQKSGSKPAKKAATSRAMPRATIFSKRPRNTRAAATPAMTATTAPRVPKSPMRSPTPPAYGSRRYPDAPNHVTALPLVRSRKKIATSTAAKTTSITVEASGPGRDRSTRGESPFPR